MQCSPLTFYGFGCKITKKKRIVQRNLYISNIFINFAPKIVQIKNNNMKRVYTHPSVGRTEMQPGQMLCSSGGGSGFKAEIGEYGTNTGGGFIQEP